MDDVNDMPPGRGHLYYGRHFSLLIGMAGLLMTLNLYLSRPGPVAAFALYGGLHASALALCLRSAPALHRKLLFIASAAMLSLSIAYLGLRAAPFAAMPPGFSGPGAILAACSIAGALGYGFLIRAFRMLKPGAKALATIALACALATGAAFYAGVPYRAIGSVSLAFPWWCAFSGGLWYHDSGGI